MKKECEFYKKKKEDYTEEELILFQKYIDFWFNDYVPLTGKDGCTNYIHMLSAGHVHFYLKQYKNLSKFSNQGWESLNAMIKTYFFRSTNRGGGGGKGDRTKTKLDGIGRWLQRRLMWLCYDTDRLFDDKEISDNGNNDDELNETELFGTEFQVGDVIEEIGPSQEM